MELFSTIFELNEIAKQIWHKKNKRAVVISKAQSQETENSKRTISMPDKLIEYLHEYEAWWQNQKKYLGDRLGDTDRLFCTEDGKDICPGLLRVWLQKSLARAGLPIVTLHSLRHTNITLQLMVGVDMKTVSARAGHSKASTTSDFYSHFIKNSDIHASEILNKIFE